VIFLGLAQSLVAELMEYFAAVLFTEL